MSAPNLEVVRAQMRAQVTASAMQIIGTQNERQAEWLANRLIERLDAFLQPADGVIRIDPNPNPADIMAQIHDFTSDLMRSAFSGAIDVMMAALTLGVKVGQAGILDAEG